ncbi:hypothetical protein ACHAW5_002574 [Stephanodiscus triporus]|uniref:Uncharacterized protein n=1 Tax=Stephanodiscus triporus TaxID=2934178 RepID=A0ABD3P033_9STRA
MAEHWARFQKQERARLAESAMPIDAVELERQRRRQSGLCSVKSLLCCLTVLVGKPSTGRAKDTLKRPASYHRRSFENDDDSFGYNFDDEQISPRVLSRLANGGHNFN